MRKPRPKASLSELKRGMLRSLRQEARERQISTNVLISQIFRQYLDWHSGAAKAGFVLVRRGTILKLLENTPQERIRDIGRSIGINESKDFVLILRHEFSLMSALDVVETWVKISGYSYKHEIRGGTHSLVIHHDMGMKWSIYLSEIYKSIFEQFEQSDAKINLAENTVHVSFTEVLST